MEIGPFAAEDMAAKEGNRGEGQGAPRGKRLHVELGLLRDGREDGPRYEPPPLNL